MRHALALAVAALALAPATASASMARVVVGDSCNGDVACEKYGAGMPVDTVVYSAAPGEANSVAVSQTLGVITIKDAGATITAEAPCHVVNPHRVNCTEGFSGISLHLGDGNDFARAGDSLGAAVSFDGGEGDDTLVGGFLNETFDGGPGADRITGAVGDVLSFAARHEGVVVDIASGRTSDGDTFSGITTVWGGEGADRLLGGPRADRITGGGGADTISGRGGDDILSGDLGADHVDGGAGGDSIDGDPPQGDGYYTPIVHLSADVLRGGPGADLLTDTGGANTLEGGSGADTLTAGAGRDRLSGGSGADRLTSGAGRDRLSGGSGADRLTSGAGRDRLSGGSGADRISAGSGRDSVLARDGRRDRVACGGGRDTARIDAKDRLRACEKVFPRRYTRPR